MGAEFTACTGGVKDQSKRLDSLGIFGHEAVHNMHLSVGFVLGGQDVFASAVCEEGGEFYFYDWLQYAVEARDKVEFRRVESGISRQPRRKYRMNSPGTQQGAAGDAGDRAPELRR